MENVLNVALMEIIVRLQFYKTQNYDLGYYVCNLWYIYSISEILEPDEFKTSFQFENLCKMRGLCICNMSQLTHPM